MRLVPLPCNWVADGLEAGMLLNIKAYPAFHCDVNTNLERIHFDDPDAVGELRTEEKMARVGLFRAAMLCYPPPLACPYSTA